MNNFYQRSLNATKEKYYKFKRRLEKKISSGQFDTLPRKKKNLLVSRVEKYRTRLDKLGFSMRGAVVAGSAAAMAIPVAVSGQTKPYFTKGEQLTVSSGQRHVEIANFDADSDLEILFASYGGGIIQNGSVEDGFSYTAVPSLINMDSRFVVGDLDGDLDNDIVFAEQYSGAAVYLFVGINDGSGNFSTTYLAYESNLQDIQLVDFDSDGDLDVLIANDGSSIKSFVNNGSGNLVGGESILPGYSNIRTFKFADLDQDGDMDLIHSGFGYDFVFKYDRENILIRENNAGPAATPVFGSLYRIAAPQYDNGHYDINLFDQDGDGDLDVVSRFVDQGSVSYIRTISNLYNSGGEFQFSANGEHYLGSGSYGSMSVFDFDNDGDDDLLLDLGGYGAELLVNTSAGGEFNRFDLNVFSYGGEFARNFTDFALADLDGDGADDIVGATTLSSPYLYVNDSEISSLGLGVNEFSERKAKTGDKVAIILAQDEYGNGIFPSISITGDDAGKFSDGGEGTINVGGEDLDFETQNEFSITIEASQNGMTKFYPFTLRLDNSPETGFATFENVGGESNTDRMYKSQMGDLNGDGKDDLVYTSGSSVFGSIYTLDLANNNSPSYLRYGSAFQIADLDDDGDNDIAIASGASIYFFMNDGSGNFTSDSSVNTFGSTITDIEVVDIDNDGDNDFVIGNYGNGGIVKDLGGYFSSVASFGFTGNVRDVAVGDIDDDGYADIFHIDGNGNYMALVDNFEGTSFSRATTFDHGYTNRVEILDLDNDGDNDLLTFNRYDFRVLDNNGGGSFTAFSAVYASSYMSRTAIALGDFDGDEDIDIVVRDYDYIGGETASIFINDGTNYFQRAQEVKIGDGNARLTGLSVGDVDGDDDLDIVAGWNISSKYEYTREINILENKNVAPYITGITGDVIIDENIEPNSILGFLDIYDPNGEDITIGDLSGDDSDLFTINTNGRLKLKSSAVVDWEIRGSNLDLNVSLSDGNSERITPIPVKVRNLAEKGSGTFSSEGLPLFGAEETRFFEPGDYDLDGDQDLFKSSFTNGGEGGPRDAVLDSYFPNSIFKQESGTFADNPLFFDPSDYFKYMTFIDYDNDGDMDLLANIDYDLYLFGNDGGEFSYIDDDAFYGEAIGMELGKFSDTDSKELVILSKDGSRVDIELYEVDASGALNQGDGINLINGGCSPLIGGEANHIAVADFDGDGFDDVFLSTRDADDYMFWGGGESGLNESDLDIAITQNDNGLSEITTADFNGDGHEDIAILRRSSSGTDNLRLDIHLNDGEGNFTKSETKTVGGEDYGKVQAGDIDGDGTVDLITTGYYYLDGEQSYNLTTWTNDGEASFTKSQTVENVGGEEFKLMDVDGDDDLDIVVNDRRDSDRLNVFKNVNVAPTDITLSNSNIDESLPLGTSIATVSIADPNKSDTHSTFIASGDGTNDADNKNFVISGDQLLVIKNIEFNDGNELKINIKTIDQDGASFSKAFTLTVNEVLGLENENENFILYPNPGNNEIAISIDNPIRGDLELRIIDVSGKLIDKITDNKQSNIWSSSIDMTNAEAGVYVVEININGQQFKQRWIKQ